MKKHYRPENNCLNCATILDGHYCHNCGQENLEIKENFGHLMNHAVSDYFHFDHQFFHTLKPLLFQPGKLTNEYMAGKRVQYLHPIKMYIFISLIFFVLIFKKSADDKEDAVVHKKLTHKEAVRIKKKLDKAKVLTPGQKEMIVGAVNKQVAADAKVIKKDSVKAERDDNDDNTSFTPFGIGSSVGDTDDSTYASYLTSQQKLPEQERDGFFRRLYERKMFGYKRYGNRAREIFMEDFRHNIPKMMFVLLPMFALILSVAFWRNHKYYVEHLIFSFHLHSFIFLSLIISMLIQLLIPSNWDVGDWISFAINIGIIIYIYKALKAVYHRGRGRTISKIFGICFMYTMVFALCMGLLFVITAVTAV